MRKYFNIKERPLQVLGLLGVLGTVFYMLHISVGTALYDGYDSLSQAISDLTAVGAPSKNTALIFTLLYGISMTAFAIIFFVFFRKRINKIFAIGALLFIAMNIVTWGYMLFPLSKAGGGETFSDTMHLIVTFAVVGLTIMSLILFTIGLFKYKQHIWLAIVTICALVLMAAGAMLINALPEGYLGLGERINIYSLMAYCCVISIWMFLYNDKKIQTN